MSKVVKNPKKRTEKRFSINDIEGMLVQAKIDNVVDELFGETETETKPITPPTAATPQLSTPNIEDDAICYIETDITAFAGVYNADKNGFDVAKNIEGDMFFVPFDLVRGYKVI